MGLLKWIDNISKELTGSIAKNINPDAYENYVNNGFNEMPGPGTIAEDLIKKEETPYTEIIKETANEKKEEVQESIGNAIENVENIVNGGNENTIKDETMSGIESMINGVDFNSWKEYSEEQQKKLWAREDAIRKETQQREDTAYQRAAADMRAAGINPNLIGINPANSGGGVTTIASQSESPFTNEAKYYLELLDNQINNDFKEDENKKDRYGQLISALLMAALMKK